MNSILSPVTNESWWWTPARLLIFLIGIGALSLLATVPLNWDQQLTLGVACILLATIVGGFSKSPKITLVFLLLSAFSTGRYAYWRISQTYNYLSVNGAEARWVDLFFVFALLGAEIYAFVILYLGFFQTLRPLNRKPAPLPGNIEDWPSVDVFIPTYNEPLEVVRTTVLAAMSMDWPPEKFNVYLLDDGRRREFEEFAFTAGCGYIVRPDNKHAKAGNINHALKKTSGEYVAIFDCDHIPTRSFLQVTLGWFLKDTGLAMLQTPHHFYSPDPFERNLGTFRDVPNEGALFYGVIQDGSDFWNGSFFCGSCAVIRRKALEEIGGVAVETVTEDAHTSLRLQRRGWNTAYLKLPQAAGLATGSLAAHIGQRTRWARGMAQILRTDNPLFGRGLKLPQRLCYFNSMLHFLYAGPRLMFLISPLVYLLLGYSNIYGYGRAILAYALPHLAFAIITNSRVQGRFRFSFWNEIYETVLAPYILLPTTVALISPKHGKFNVTSKSDQVDDDYFDWRLAAPYITILLLNLAGITVGIIKILDHSRNTETILINIFWCLLNVIVSGAATAVAHEVEQRRVNVRISTKIPVTVVTPDGRQIAAQTIDISRGGFSIPLARNQFRAIPGERAAAQFRWHDREYSFPAIVVEANSRISRFSFGSLDISQERELTQVIFGRADAWVDWRLSQKGDRPLLSLLQIIGIALQGIAALPVAFAQRFRRRPATADQSEVAIAEQAVLPSVILLAGALLFGLAAGPFPLKAQTAEASSVFKDSYDLASLGHREPVMMKGIDARATLNFGIPVTKVVTQARLQITYRSAPALAPNLSTVAVSLNGSNVGTFPIAASADGDSLRSAEVDLPYDLLTGDNSVSFQLKPHCIGGCGNITPEALWFRIEGTTNLQLSGSVLPIGNDLRLLPEPFFDSSSHRAAVANLAFAEVPDVRTLEAAGVIASWLGTLADYRGIHFPVTVGSIPKGNVIVFLPKGSGIVPDSYLASLTGSAIALRDNPSDPYGKILIITGDDEQEMLQAARVLASGRFPRSGDSATLAGIDLPAPRVPYDAPRWLAPSSKAALGGSLAPDDLRVYGDGSADLYFRLPPDAYFGDRSYVPLQINYELSQWTSATRGEMRIKLNGHFITTRPLHQIPGGGRQVQKVGLPVDDILAANTLTVEFALQSAAPLNSSRTPEEQVLRNSSLDLSGLTHYVELPRLDLFANAGFPFTKYADLSQIAVVMPDKPTPEETSLYLAALGICGARTGYPALRVTVVHPDEVGTVASKDLLVVGGSDHASGPLFSAGPARLEGNSIQVAARSEFWFKLPAQLSGTELNHLRDLVSSDPAPTGFISEFASPIGNGRSVVSLQAADANALKDLEQSLAESAGLSAVYGNLSVFEAGRMHSFILPSGSYSAGNLPWDEQARVWAKDHYWLIPLFLFCLTLILAVPLNSWLERRAVLRLQGQLYAAVMKVAPLLAMFAAVSQTLFAAPANWPLWQSYSSRFLSPDGRIIDRDRQDCTTSEGQAYALFFALVANDRVRFDKMLSWTERNLSKGDLKSHLPAWRWEPSGSSGKVADANSASDADLWIAYALLEAGRLWNEPGLSQLGRAIANHIAAEEVVDIPQLGAMLLPGPVGFKTPDGFYELNASYLPVQILLGVDHTTDNHLWREIAARVPRVVEASARGGFVMDWISFKPGDGFSVFPSPVSEPLASYDAIRVYLWAGMLDNGSPYRTELFNAGRGMTSYLMTHPIPPAEVTPNGQVKTAASNVGFSAALLPMLQAMNLAGPLKNQIRRIELERDLNTGLYGDKPRYYDQNLALFATGWCEGRFKFEANGSLKVSWK